MWLIRYIGLLIHPDSKFKIIWDLIIIFFSVYNALTIPYEFAYSLDTNIFFYVLDRILDATFIIDVFVNFRTIYIDSRTGDEVRDGKKIAIKYVLYGRFFIDLIASIPLDLITLLPFFSGFNFKFLGLLKMTRLLRLGRIITFLKANQQLKFSMKFSQLVFFLILIVHFYDCIWYTVTAGNETWFPPKNIDSGVTNAYTADSLTKYLLFYNYGLLMLVGAEILPSNNLEQITAVFLVLCGTIFLGTVIGEFTFLLSSFTKSQREQSEELDIISQSMLNLRIPEDIQTRVLDFYEKMSEARYIKEARTYDMLSPNLTNYLKTFQIFDSLKNIKILDDTNKRQVYNFISKVEISYFLSGDIIIKEGNYNDTFYCIHKGIVEVIQEKINFQFFDFREVEKFIKSNYEIVEINQSKIELASSGRKETQPKINAIHPADSDCNELSGSLPELLNSQRGLATNNIFDNDFIHKDKSIPTINHESSFHDKSNSRKKHITKRK